MKFSCTFCRYNQSTSLNLTLLILSTICLLSFTNTGLSQTFFTEDWESGIGNWYADNGVWEVGNPTVGPPITHSGTNCAGTILDGNYPLYADTRLISPEINLPSLSGNGKILLKFWHWYVMQYGADKGLLQISVNSGTWQTISNPKFDGTSNAWCQYVADLSAYADSSIRIAFYFTSDGNTPNMGWYIDDVLIEMKDVVFPNPEDFELGIGDWYADNGVWEVGNPTVGPPSSHSGTNCAGTILDGNYPLYANSRLISPEINLPSLSGNEKILLKFWQWYVMQYGADNGLLQISVNYGNWQTISNPKFDGTSNAWCQYVADLSAYADSSIRIAFYFTSDGNTPNMGWYIDDVLIEIKDVVFPNPEDFELGIGDWYADNGVWEVGIPTVGPPSSHSGTNCAGTILDGNYPLYANSRLISPEIMLTSPSGENPWLYFYHWYTMQVGADNGVLQISVNYGAWQTISNIFNGTNNTWSQYGQNLSAYKDSSIRIAFYFTSDGNTPNMGWYIDDIRIEGIVNDVINNQNEIPHDFSITQNYPNPFNPTTRINYKIPNTSFVTLKFYDVLGNQITSLVNEEKPAGSYDIEFDGSGLTSGVYFYKITAGNYIETKKMLLMK